MKTALQLGLLLLTGCDALPRDASDTSRNIAIAHVIRVGVASRAAGRPEVARLLQALAAASGARAQVRFGEGEQPLTAVEQGELDLVIAWFDQKTPWADHVALGPPLAQEKVGEHALELRAAVRNGENRWVMLVEKSSRASASVPS